MIGYHFTTDRLRNGLPLPPVGTWLHYYGEVVPCERGLHASEHPFDAMTYAPGNTLHLVELTGDLTPHGNPTDKHAGRNRRILATVEAQPMLYEFARWCALQVIHLWDAPTVAKEYLETGREDLQEAAWEAARAARAARAAQRDKFLQLTEGAFDEIAASSPFARRGSVSF